MNELRRHRESGQALVEFVLVLPILTLIVLAIIQFGTLYNSYVTITNATRAGARAAAVSRATGNVSGAATSAVMSSASGLDQSKLGVSVSGGASPGAQVSVTVTYPYSISLVGIVVKSGTLSSTTAERTE